MLTELKCGKTHVQFFIEGNCIGTVRVEYGEAVKTAIEAQIAGRPSELKVSHLANGSATETSTNK